MRTFRLDKLVKDEVYEAMLEAEQDVVCRFLGREEFAQRILEKIVEETAEYQESGEESELRDCQLAVFSALKAGVLARTDNRARILDDVPSDDLVDVFESRVFIETVTLAEDDPWVDYYVAHPDRFAEVMQ